MHCVRIQGRDECEISQWIRIIGSNSAWINSAPIGMRTILNICLFRLIMLSGIEQEL